jgi:hypothetical protein
MEARKKKGYASALLEISSSTDLPENISISAAVYFG